MQCPECGEWTNRLLDDGTGQQCVDCWNAEASSRWAVVMIAAALIVPVTALAWVLATV